MLYDLLKAAHIVAVIIWFGGTMAAVLALSYTTPVIIAKFARFDRMVTTPALAVVWLAGITMAVWYGWFNSGWLITKLVFVVALSALHGVVSGRLRRARLSPSANPVIILVSMFLGLAIIVSLAVTKVF